MTFLTDFLDKNGIQYLRKDIKNYGDAGGARVSVPTAWNGSVILINEKVDQAKAMTALVEELAKYITTCQAMRNATLSTPSKCSKVPDDALIKTKRDNSVCKSCPTGKKIKELSDLIESMFDTEQDVRSKISKEFFEKEDGDGK